MSDRVEVDGWSCYTTSPARSLELFETARGRCPLPHSEQHDGFFMLLNYADVRSAMMDYRTFSSEPQVLRPMLPRKCIPALDMDPPRHTAWRAIQRGHPAEARTRHGVVRADGCQSPHRPLHGGGSCDIVHELAEPVPAETICRLVGIDEAIVPRVRETALAMFAAQGNPDEFARRQAGFAAVTVSEVHERQAPPG
jgi:cytochrome P450